MLQTPVGDGDDDSDDWSEESGFGTMLSQPPHATEPDGPSNTRHSPTNHIHDLETSLAPSSDSWESAIYDDYRYSRYSMTTKTARYPSSGAPASSEQPLPLPVSDTRDSRPSAEPSTQPSVTRSKLSSRLQIPLSLQPRALTAQVATPEPSPLLHTNWGSPTSSVHDTDALLYTSSSLVICNGWGNPHG
jgi:hypothetical protein